MRAFFALWPDEEARIALQAQANAAAIRTKGRAVAPDKLHLTLVFLGDVDEPTAERLAAGAAGLEAGRVVVSLSRAGCWRKAGVAWLAPETAPPELSRLEEALAALARRCGARLESRPYFPHMTLARGAAEALPEATIVPIRLEFSDFVLVRSDLGSGRYEVIGRWPLGR